MFKVTQTFQTRYVDIPCKGDRTAEFDTVELAEKRARYWTKRFGYESEIFLVVPPKGKAKGTLTYIATTLTDALGKTWTQVSDEGGKFL